LIIAARPPMKPGPLTGRSPKSPVNPTTSVSWIEVWLGGWTRFAEVVEKRTSRTRSGVEAAPTT
jgi:hypothetical protein